MEPLAELSEALSGRCRAIVIAEREVDLSSRSGENRLLILKIAEGSLAAGGRGGGFGERRVVRVAAFEGSRGLWKRTFETEAEEMLGRFEVPFNVSRMPFVLEDGTETVGYGVLDPELVAEFIKKSQ